MHVNYEPRAAIAAQAAGTEIQAAMAAEMETEPWETVMDHSLFEQFMRGLCRRSNYILQCWYSDMSIEDRIKVLRRYARTPPEDRQGHKSVFWKNWYREFLGLRDRSRSPRR